MMKLYSRLLIGLVSLLLLACTSSSEEIDVKQFQVENHETEVSEGDFIFRLISEKEQYTQDEPVNLYGEIVYVGDKEEVDIVHSSSAIVFNIFEEARQYELGDGVADIGITTTLERNVPYRETYEKNIGYDSESPKDYIKFVEDFIGQNGVPIGYYKVKGMTDFAIFEDGEHEEAKHYNIKASIDFKVQD